MLARRAVPEKSDGAACGRSWGVAGPLVHRLSLLSLALVLMVSWLSVQRGAPRVGACEAWSRASWKRMHESSLGYPGRSSGGRCACMAGGVKDESESECGA